MVDWDSVRDEVTGYLQDLIRFDTTNPPGNETPAAEHLAHVLSAEGFEPVVLESAPGRGNVVARLRGKGHAPPLMLLGHLDVVEAEPDKWRHPPFSGDLVGDYVWGRGATDMKGMIAMSLACVVQLARQRITLDRDVIFAATADEEAGKGWHGIGWLMDYHGDLVDAPYILTEGGGREFAIGGRRYYGCQTGQKGLLRFRLQAQGRPGHGSVPHGENAVVRLCESVARLGAASLPLHPSQTMRAFVERAAASQDPQMAARLRDVLDPERSDEALSELPIEAGFARRLGAMLHNTVSPTILSAGSQINVIPSEAFAHVDGRIVPGATRESVVAEIRDYVGENVKIIVDQYSPAMEASNDSPIYRAIEAVMARCDADAPVVPLLSTGATDAKHIVARRPDVQIYGFIPAREDPDPSARDLLHAHDERVSVDNLMFGTRVIHDIVCEFCGA